VPHSRFPDDLPPIVPAFESASDAERTRAPGIEVPILWVSEPTGECSFLSDSWYEFTGFAPGAGLGDGWADAIHADDRAAAYDGFVRAAHERGPVRLEYRLRRQDGSYRWVLDAAAARFDTDGAFRGYLGFIVDIHDRRQIETSLRLQSELLAQTHDAVVVWELAGSITYWNHGAEELYGYTSAEATGRRIHDLLHTVHPGGADAFDAMLQRQGRWQGELTHLTRAGRRVIVESRQVLRQQSGRTYVMEINRDVTERRRTEDELRRSEAHLRLVADHAPVLMAHCDTEGRFKYVNESYASRFGLRAADLVGRLIPEVLGANAFAAIKPHMERVVAGESVRYETEVPYDTLGPRVMECLYEPERDSAGHVRGWIAVVTDVTERHRAQQTIRDSERRFRELADSMPQIVFTARPDGFTDYFNRRWYELTGLPDGETRDEVWTAALHPDDRQRCLETWYASVNTLAPYQIEYRFKFPACDGYRWHLARALPVRNAEGRVTGWYGTCTDIHDFKLAQQALRDADRRKDEFLAMLAHELRNPLAPIRSAVRVLRRLESSDPRLAEMRDVIDRQADQLTRLVDDLLDVSRITQGKVTLRHERLELRTIVGRAVEMIRPIIDARRHHLTIDVPPETLLLHGDLTRLAQVLANLLNNAAKYTPEGGRIWLEGEVRDGMLVLRVRDNGQGIPSEQIDKVFDLFMQVDRAPDSSEGGLGIGLTLVRQLIELHGGRVTASSDGLGRGSEFIIELPAMAADGDAAAGSAPAGGHDAAVTASSLRILVVDDNVDSAETMSMLLALDGHAVRMAHDGPSAVAAALASSPHVILLDIGLPGLDGYAVARMLRQRPEMQTTVLVALTGYGMDDDRQRSREAGFDHHLIKPVDPATLSALIGSLSA
jgi:PAS domain S-box-containing protein